MSTVIAVVSGKGGTGKTTATAALASALALAGRRVIAIDADAGLRNLDLALGLYNETAYDFTDVLEDRAPLERALAVHPRIPGLKFLAAPGGVNAKVIDPEQFADLIDAARPMCDFCLIDGPAGLNAGFAAAVASADRAIVVATPDIPCIRDAAVTSEAIEDLGVDEFHLLINRFRPSLVKKKQALNIDDAMDKSGMPLIGVVPEDSGVVVAMGCAEPLMLTDNMKARLAFHNISLRLLGEKIPLMRIR